MAIRPALLASAALGVLCAVAAGQAEAAPARHHKPAAADAGLRAEVRQLREQVEALQAAIAAQQAAAQQTQTQVEQAQSQAQAAQAAAQTAQAQVQTAQAAADDQIRRIPATVKTEVDRSRPKPGWEANTSVSGRMYANLSYIDMERDGNKIAPSGVGLDIKRFYIGVDHKFSSMFSGNVTTDVQYNSAESLTQVYIKKAYLQARFSDALALRLGSADMPWIPYAEDVYGYRFVEQTLTDRTKFGTSADWGVHALGKVGMFNYAVAVVNGAGYKNPVRSKSMDIEGRISTNIHGLNLAVGGYSGKLGKDVQNGAATFHTAQRFNALAAYVQPRYRIGIEYFYARNWNNVTTSPADAAQGISAFGSFTLTPKVSVFGKYEHVEPTRISRPGVGDDYFNIGVNYEPAKIVDLALVYKHDRVENGLLNTGNGAIGTSLLGSDGTYDEFGLFMQYRW